MGLSRLDNFLKNIKGEILYVDPSSLDSTDSIENQGNSLARPFKTIQRALIEASRFSYQRGKNNDRFGKTTILLYPGEHVVDNRPGWIPTGLNTYLLRNSDSSSDFAPFSRTSDFDLDSVSNQLYKFNSVHGGVIVPRGTSIVGLDLRKTRIRPKYIPDPENDNIERSAIFRLTGSSYIWQFTILDGDPNGNIYKDYTTNQFIPNFSHHKLTVFEYADGINGVDIRDDFITYTTSRTDLDMYYEKVGLAYGNSSGRNISPDYPSSAIDIQTKVDEHRIVGSTGEEVSITNIYAGNAIDSSTVITVELSAPIAGLDVDTPIQVQNVDTAGYSGQHVISEVIDPTTIKYQVQNPPLIAAPPAEQIANANLVLISDTVTSASPYIFNVSLRSVFGMCGLHADGSKAGGFRSMVVAQFTGIGLQKDDNAFILYNPQTGAYEDQQTVDNLYSNSRAIYKPEYENYHIKASNNSFIQIVSVFAIGYANHFVSESGGDLSITNSNSNFGARSLLSKGYRTEAFLQDNFGYITHIIPPRENESELQAVEYDQIDIQTTNSAANAGRLYLYNQKDDKVVPDHVLDGYRIGAKKDETLNVFLTKSGVTQNYSAPIIMSGGSGQFISEKSFTVAKKANQVSNQITNNIITFTQPHSLVTGETVRILSSNGHLPDGLVNNQIYYVITNEVATGIGSTQIKLSNSLNEARINQETTIYSNETSEVKIVSRVSDKKCGEVGHPVQFDTTRNQWYVSVASTSNQIASAISDLTVAATPRTYFTRKSDTRSYQDSIYRVRYVIPKGFLQARIPSEGFVLQESHSTIGESNQEIQKYLSLTNQELDSTYEIRNFRFIASATWSANTNLATFTSELPHGLSVGSQVTIKNVISTTNTSGTDNLGYNGVFTVISAPTRKTFTVAITVNPGTFANQTSIRNTSLPYFIRSKYNKTYVVYRTQEIQRYIPGERDGVYYLIVLNSSNSPNISPFEDFELLQPVQNLYPQVNRDNFTSDPIPAKSFASPSLIGDVIVNDPEKSITKETINESCIDAGVGLRINNIVSDFPGQSHEIFTSQDHGLNRILSVSITNPGQNYGTGIGISEVFYNARLVGLGTTVVGDHATAIVQVSNTTGELIRVKIIDGGSAYGIGNTLAVVGIATTTGHSLGFVRVDSIYNNVGDTVSVNGVGPDSADQYNTVYRISKVSVGSTNMFEAVSASPFPPIRPGAGIGATSSENAFLVFGEPSVGISTIQYNGLTGIATFTTQANHGFLLNNKIKIGGATNNRYNGDFVIKRVPSRTTFEVKVGTSTVTTLPGGTIIAYKERITSNGGAITKGNENLSGRQIPYYAGISTVLSGPVIGPEIDNITINNAQSLQFEVGDYLLIDDEIVRISQTVVSNQIQVFRGVLGTLKNPHTLGSKVTKIVPIPVELRRNSIISASGHTFEYMGYGPGNYSTALPERQDRKLSPKEEILASELKLNGGVAVYTAMNSDGAFYIGNKKTVSATGQEEVFNSPIPSATGEDVSSEGVNIGFDILSPLEISISRSIKVEGGEDGTIISKFNGPVVFTNRITSISEKGIEAKSLFLQGNELTSKKYTVGISAPLEIGSAGDVVFNINPTSGGHLGWVYTTNNIWEQFGPIKNGQRYVGIWSGIDGVPSFFGDGSGLFNVSDVWRRDVLTGLVTTSNIGIGTTLSKPGVSLYVNGTARFDGLTTFRNSTQSISTSTGAVIVEGGAAVQRNLNVGQTFSVTGVSSLNALNVVGYSTFVGLTSFVNDVNFDDNVTMRHLNVTGITTIGTNLYIKKQSIRSYVNSISIIFGL